MSSLVPYLVLPVVGFLLAFAFARYRDSRWIEQIQQGAIGAIVSFGITGLIGQLNDCCTYVIDSDARLGWNVPSTDTDRKLRGGAFLTRRFSTEGSQDGHGALEVDVDLRGGTEKATPPMDRGEVFVLVQQFPPAGGRIGVPQNLWLSRVRAVIEVPPSLVSERSAVTASFVQLFFETCPPESRRFDGKPGEQIHEGGPIVIEYRWWTPKARAACRLGIKMGLNHQDLGTYQGRAFISGVRWTPVTWYVQILSAIALLAGGVAVNIWATRKSRVQKSAAASGPSGAL